MAAGGAHGCEDTVEIHPKHPVPRGHFNVLQAACIHQETAAGAHARIGKHAIDAARLRRQRIHQAVHRSAIADIQRRPSGLRVVGLQSVQLDSEQFGVEVGHDDLGAEIGRAHV